MKFDPDEIPVTFLITGVCIAMGTAFELGYFYKVGFQFISMVSAAEWIISLTVVSLPVLLGAQIIVALYKAIKRRWDNMDDRPICLNSWNRLLDRAIPIIAVFSWVVLTILFPHWWTAIFAVCSLLAGIVLFSGDMSFYGDLERIPHRELAFYFMQTLLTLFLAGIFYGDFGGQTCKIYSTDNHFETTTYLRAIGDGHLFRDANDDIVFVPKDRVAQIVCPGRAQMLKDTKPQ